LRIVQQEQEDPEGLRLDRDYLTRLDEAEFPLSNLYVSETKDGFQGAHHRATSSLPRLTFGELSSSSEQDPFVRRKCSTIRKEEFVTPLTTEN
jgi:hypothetical protein